MADKKYSNLTVIITSSKDCPKCTRLKNTGTLDGIINGLKAKGVRVVVKECETKETDTPYPPTTNLHQYLNNIVGWFPEFIVIPNGYYDNADNYSIGQLISVSGIFNGEYGPLIGKNKERILDKDGNPVYGPIMKSEYSTFSNDNFLKFFDKYMSSTKYNTDLPRTTDIGPNPVGSGYRPIPNHNPTYSSAPRFGTGIGPGPNGATPTMPSNAQRQTSGLDAPGIVEPASKSDRCTNIGFVLFKR